MEFARPSARQSVGDGGEGVRPSVGESMEISGLVLSGASGPTGPTIRSSGRVTRTRPPPDGPAESLGTAQAFADAREEACS